MRALKISLLTVLAVITLTGCAFRYYIGMHGPSVKNHQDIHAGITKDSECLACHGTLNNQDGPATTHPQFTGCLKCHNDDLTQKGTAS
jgi:hypothetical protein